MERNTLSNKQMKLLDHSQIKRTTHPHSSFFLSLSSSKYLMPIPSIFVAGEIAKAVVTGWVGWVGGGGIQVAVILGNSTKAALNQAFFTCHASLPPSVHVLNSNYDCLSSPSLQDDTEILVQFIPILDMIWYCTHVVSFCAVTVTQVHWSFCWWPLQSPFCWCCCSSFEMI